MLALARCWLPVATSARTGFGIRFFFLICGKNYAVKVALPALLVEADDASPEIFGYGGIGGGADEEAGWSISERARPSLVL